MEHPVYYIRCDQGACPFLKSDLYILPSSIHELILVPMGVQRIRRVLVEWLWR